jgi:hypothetical protein
VQRQAVEIAREGNVYGDVASDGVLSTGGNHLEHSAIRAEARAAARNPSL